MIAKELLAKKEEIRSLNISYNVSLSTMDPKLSAGTAEEMILSSGSKEFLDILVEFLTDNCFIVHLDFSGMGLLRDQIL